VRSAWSSPIFFNAYGTKVTLIEMMPRILPVEDEESSALV